MSYYIREGVDLKEVPMSKVETLMNAGVTIISDKDIIKELKQQLEEAIFFIEQKVCCDIRVIPTSIGDSRVHRDDCWKCDFLAKYRGGEVKDIKWMLANYSSGEIARDAISEIINLEQQLAKLKEENEKFRKMLQDNEDKYIEYRDDLYYEISKLKELLRRFVPDERTIQWEQREIDARDFLKKYDMAIGHDFRSERLKKH